MTTAKTHLHNLFQKTGVSRQVRSDRYLRIADTRRERLNVADRRQANGGRAWRLLKQSAPDWPSAQTQSKDSAPRSCRLFRPAGTEAIWAADDEGPVALVNLLSESVH